MTTPSISEDFRDLLVELLNASVRFLLVGAHAMAVHGVPRATGDIDIWIAEDETNAKRTFQALERFGAPLAAHGITANDFTALGMVYQIGLPPRRIDLMTSIDGVEFAEAWPERMITTIDGIDVPVIGRKHLMQNKRSTGREKDHLDLKTLERGDIDRD
jgi:hypothetical protein